MILADIVAGIPDLSSWNYADKITFFCWHMHTHKDVDHFSARDIRNCFDELNLQPPSSVQPFLTAMLHRKPPRLLRSRNGYALERRVRQEFDAKYGQRESSIAVDRMLSDLPNKVTGIDERVFLQEAITCFRHKAFRATIVMAWNLAYDHFLRWIFNDPVRLSAFNVKIAPCFPRAEVTSIRSFDDFARLREDQVLTVANSAKVIDPNLYREMKEKLTKRNTFAHPSKLVASQVTAEACLTDLVQSVILQLP